MLTDNEKHNKLVTISDLYPELTPDEQQQAAYYLRRYIEVVRDIFERRQDLTDPDGTSNMPMH